VCNPESIQSCLHYGRSYLRPIPHRVCLLLCVCVFITAGPITKLFAGGGRRRVEDMCYERRRSEACVDESAHPALANAGGREIVGKKDGEQKGSARGACIGPGGATMLQPWTLNFRAPPPPDIPVFSTTCRNGAKFFLRFILHFLRTFFRSGIRISGNRYRYSSAPSTFFQNLTRTKYAAGLNFGCGGRSGLPSWRRRRLVSEAGAFVEASRRRAAATAGVVKYIRTEISGFEFGDLNEKRPDSENVKTRF
jgi:hypothetical protein